MGRSVSTANDSLLVAYQEYEEDSWLDFSEYADDIRDYAKTLWPSFTACDVWLGREDHAILENGLGYIGLSEYCGVVSIWFVAKESTYWFEAREDLAKGFAARIEKRFDETFSAMHRVGGFSDGTSVYQRVA